MASESTTIVTVTEDPGKGTLILNDSITDLNVTTTEYIPIVTAAVAFASLLAVGILCVTLFIVVLFRGRTKFQEFPFFAIVYHLTLANACHVFMQCTTVLPIMLLESDEDSANRFWYKVGSYFIMITEQASLYLTFLMAINRLVVFIFPEFLRFFTTKNIHIISIFLWVYINFIVFWNYNYGTVKAFSRKTLSAQEQLLGTNYLTKFFTLCSAILPVIMLFMYCIIYLYIVKKRKDMQSNQNTDRDRVLMIQALIVTISLEVVNITDMITPFLKTAPTSVTWVWTIFCYCVSIFNQLVNPLLFFLMNTMVQNVVKHLFDKNISRFLFDNSSAAKVQDSRAQPIVTF